MTKLIPAGRLNGVVLTFGVAFAAGRALAGLYGDTPDAKHAWCVHDCNRPNPVKVAPAVSVGQPPSDAVVLFDGTAESLAKNWCDKNGQATKWVYDAEERTFGLKLQCEKGKWTTGAGTIFTKEKFGDCQLHLEFKYPADIKGGGQMRGNSGVFLMGMYEIQVMESFDTDPADMKNPNYADGQCGAVYAENPPLVNANRRPGEWQSYDIVFHQPVWNEKTLVHPGSVTVFLNGVLVQDHWEMEGLTTHCRRRALAPHDAVRQFQLQDHGCPLSFRNVWLRPLASRWDNFTHSAMSAKEDEVMKVRRETAAALFAKIADPDEVSAKNLQSLAEVIAYANEAPYAEKFWACLVAYRAKADKPEDEVREVNKTLTVLTRNKVIAVEPVK